MQFESKYKIKSPIVQIKARSERKKYIIIISILLILQSGLRHIAVGPDTYAYYLMFEDIKSTSWEQVIYSFKEYFIFGAGKDAGYIFFQKLVQTFIKNYQIYLIFIAMIFFISFGVLIYKNSYFIREIMFAYILYSALFYQFFSITGIRQTIATAASFWGFDFIKKKKFLPFTILILLASTIHRSVLLFLPFYFLINLKKANFIYRAAVLIFPLAMIYRRPLAIIMAKASGSKAYLNYALADYKASTPVFTGLIISLVIIGLIFMRHVLKLNPDVSRFYTAIALAFIFTPLTWVDPSFMRVVLYFSIFMVFFIPKIIDIVTLSDKSIRTATYVCIYLILIFFVIKNGGEYKFFWQEMDLGENYL